MPEATLILIFVTSLLVGYSGALLPGPLIAFNVSESLRHGFWAGPALVLGHALTELLMVGALAWGLSQFLGQGWLTAAIGVAGGLVLVYMGLSVLRANWGRRDPLELEGAVHRGHQSPLVGGIVLSFFNPSWLLWWASVGSTYVLWALGLGVVGLGAFYLGHILADLSWYSLVSLIVASGRRSLSGRLYRGLLVGTGLFLTGFGGFFILRGLGLLA